MYTIVNVMYGVPLATPDHDFKRSDQLLEWMEYNEVDGDDLIGVHMYYHGGSDITPAAWGVLLQTFNECAHHTDVSSQMTTPGTIIETEVNLRYNSLPPEERALLEPFGRPRVFFLWSTS